MRRGQAAIEFVVLTGFMVLVFTVFFVLVQERAAVSQERAHLLEVASVGETVRQEFVLAAQVQPGYSRVFHLPALIGAQPYSISLYPQSRPSEIVINTSQGQYVIFLEEEMDTGSTVSAGYNQINKSASGNISINHLPEYQPPVVRACLEDADCVDELTCTDNVCDEAHGTCSFPVNCGKNQECDKDGDCACIAGYTECEECGQGDSICTMVCVDTQTDPKNCGGCGSDPEHVCADGESCVGGSCQTSACTELGKTNIIYYAGEDGYAWVDTGATARVDAQLPQVHCCLEQTQCVRTNPLNPCAEFGQYQTWNTVKRERVCLDEGVGLQKPTWFRCSSEQDGDFVSTVGATQCCSKFVATATAYDKGTYGWSPSTVDGKKEIYPSFDPTYNSCSDGSDNDCDGLPDCQDAGCATAPNCLVCEVTAPGQPSASDILDTSATVSWTLSQTVDVDEQTLFYGTDEESVKEGCPNDDDCVAIPLDDTITSTDLKSLTPNSPYHMMVRATDTNSGCTPAQANSPVGSFTTLPTETCPMSPAPPSGLTAVITIVGRSGADVKFDWIKSSRAGIDEQTLYIGSTAAKVQSGCAPLVPGVCYHQQTLTTSTQSYTWSAAEFPLTDVYALVRAVDADSICSPNYVNSDPPLLVHDVK